MSFVISIKNESSSPLFHSARTFKEEKNNNHCEIKVNALLGSTVSGWLGIFMLSWGKLFLIGLVDQLFHVAPNQGES